MDWATRIRRYRIINCMNQERLAEILGVEQSTVSRWERGKQLPDPGSRKKILSMIKMGAVADDFRLLHFVKNNPHPVSLVRDDMTVLAASHSITERFGIDPSEVEGFNYKKYANDVVEMNFKSASECGFFYGDVASITHLVRAKALDGRELYLLDLWHPAKLSDDTVAAMITAKFLTQVEYEQMRVRSGSIRIVMMQDLLGEES